MSGGVDSSVTAALLAEAGYEVVGVTLQLYDHGAASGRKGACCAGADIHDAREVAGAPGHRPLRPRLRGPLQGGRDRRFRAPAMPRAARRSPACAATSGSSSPTFWASPATWARPRSPPATMPAACAGPDGPELHRAADPAKDQSYFLFATTRRAAWTSCAFRWATSTRPPSAPTPSAWASPSPTSPTARTSASCPAATTATWWPVCGPTRSQPGEIVHVDGRVLGRHGGTARFTVGQRRGLHVADGERLYVVGIEPERRRVVVGPRHAGDCAAIAADRRQLAGRSPRRPCRWRSSIATTSPPCPGGSSSDPTAGARSTLDEPQPGVAPGQACVATPARASLGGGWIDRATRRLAVGPGPAQRLTPWAPAHR